MADLEPVGVQLLLGGQVIAGEEMSEHLDAQDADRHIAQLKRTVGDVRHLGDAGHQGPAVALAVTTAGASAQLPPGAAHDA